MLEHVSYEEGQQYLKEIDIDSEVEKHNTLVVIKDHEANLNILSNNLSNTLNSFKRSKTKLSELEANLVKAKEGVCPTCEQGTAHLDTHEAVCAERWKETILRIKRIETIMIGTAGTMILMMAGLLLR